MAISMGYIDLS